MNIEYIRMIEQRLIEMREKKELSPAQKKHLDKDADGDIDGKDLEILRKKKVESSDEMTPCPKCDGSTDNHDPECPDHPDNKGKSAEEGCGDYDKKSKKEEVEQVEYNNQPVDHDLDENFRTLATKGMGAETKKTINVGRDVDYFEPKNGDKRQGRITKVHATGYHVKDEKDGKTHSFTFHDRAKAKKMLESNQPVISEKWGFGEVIESTEEGLNVYFEHGVEFNIPEEDLTFVGEAADRAKHYKGATKPETMLDKYKGAGAKKMATDNNVESPKEADITPEEKGHEDATKAGRAVSKQSPTRRDEPRKGDISIVNPVKGAVTKTTGRE